MITLKDYLGTIVSDINEARGYADETSARLAQKYADDYVLRYYTVPRIRMQDIELNIPVGIQGLKTTAEADYQPIENNRFYSVCYNTIKDVYKISSFPRVISTKLSKYIKNQTDELEKNIKKNSEIEKNLNLFSSNISKESYLIIKDFQNSKERKKEEKEKNKSERYMIPTNYIELTTQKLNERLRPEITPPTQAKKPDGVAVIVESDKLRELPPENVVTIKLKILEQGMEWQTLENADGEMQQKLVTE